MDLTPPPPPRPQTPPPVRPAARGSTPRTLIVQSAPKGKAYVFLEDPWERHANPGALPRPVFCHLSELDSRVSQGDWVSALVSEGRQGLVATDAGPLVPRLHAQVGRLIADVEALRREIADLKVSRDMNAEDRRAYYSAVARARTEGEEGASSLYYQT